ncbi:MAG: cytochrome-c peroxidase [Chromatiales bacterium]|nr:cytochrome-c peroxidase [Chromatiales bacterium]
MHTRFAGAVTSLILLAAAADTPAEPIAPLPEPPAAVSFRVDLGARLFHDPLLSADGTVSCASCHDLATGGDDGRARSVGINGMVGGINAPTVIGTGLDIAWSWDGRAPTLDGQINGPLQSPNVMGAVWGDVIARIRSHPEYPALFASAYPERGIVPATVRDAIATFERSLIGRDNRFDRWLAGDTEALDEQERFGYDLFKYYGCSSCHQGRNVGGNLYQRLGLVNEYFAQRAEPITRMDWGRYNVTGAEEDRHVFKVPSLRMAAHTAPYLHDGSAATLRDAVDVMFRFQIGRRAPDEHKDAIVAFIKTLSPERL